MTKETLSIVRVCMCCTRWGCLYGWTKAEALKWEGLTSTVLIEALIISKQPTIAENTRKTSQYCFPRAGEPDVLVEITRSMLDQHTGRGGEGRATNSAHILCESTTG